MKLLNVTFVAAVALLDSCKTVPMNTSSRVNTDASQDHWINPWDPIAAQKWYTLPQGSHLISWDLFMNLEQPQSSEPFANKAQLSSFGFLYPSYENQNWQEDPRLPLGFRKDKSLLDQQDYLGFNCAACHTGQMSYKGENYFIHAGQGSLELDRFIVELRKSLEAHQDKAKWERLVKRLPQYPGGPKKLEATLKASIEKVKRIEHDLLPQTAGGPSRLDAVGWILNTVNSAELGLEDNWGPVVSPISIPHVWRAPELQCVQTNCAAQDPMTRNGGEVLGVFGHVNLKDNRWIPDSLETAVALMGQGSLFQSSIKFQNLFEIEQSLRSLNAPHWPTAFGPIQAELKEKGRSLYASECASCHVILPDHPQAIPEEALSAPDTRGHRHVKVSTVNYLELGTDPLFLATYGTRKAKAGVFTPLLRLAQKNASIQDAEAQNILAIAINVAVQRYFLSPEFKNLAKERFVGDDPKKAAEQLKDLFRNERVFESSPIDVYKGRPLDGIAFTGPFLHNGSVPTLWDLLQPAAQRPQKFQVGSWDFDSEKLGPKTDTGTFLFDTTLPGNSNKGHEYGTALSLEDKRALLEFLKSL